MYMQIRVEDIKEQGLELSFVEEAADFPVLADMVAAGECGFSSPVSVSIRAQHIGGMVEIDGQVSFNATFSCGRCLAGFERSLASTFSLTYVKDLPEVQNEEGGEVELTPEEMGLILFDGEEIDLVDAVQEQVIMSLPQRPVCKDQCKGLCPQCGADLNEGKCSCRGEVFNSKFAALKDFKVEKE